MLSKEQIKDSVILKYTTITLIGVLALIFVIGMITAKEKEKEKFRGYDVEDKQVLKYKRGQNVTLYYLNHTDEEGRQLKVVSYAN